MKKIYFACSIRGGRDDQHLYAELCEIIKTHAELLTEIFADGQLTSLGMNKPDRQIWDTDIAWVKEADGIIAEVTNASLGVGYEIAKAEEWGKPVLVLYRPAPDRKLSAMIAGSRGLTVVNYQDPADAAAPIAGFITNL